jgi:hypothetical protein
VVEVEVIVGAEFGGDKKAGHMKKPLPTGFPTSLKFVLNE